MKVEIRVNGTPKIRLTPITTIETAVLDIMLAAAEKGSKVTLTRDGDTAVLEVE